MQILFVVNG